MLNSAHRVVLSFSGMMRPGSFFLHRLVWYIDLLLALFCVSVVAMLDTGAMICDIRGVVVAKLSNRSPRLFMW